jgi:hypothetical protein
VLAVIVLFILAPVAGWLSGIGKKYNLRKNLDEQHTP